MVEVDPLILVAAGSAVFGLATIAICMGKSSPSNVTKTTTSSTSKPTKKKSKSVSKNVKSSKPIEQSTATNVSKNEISDEDVVETSKTVISNKPAVVVKEDIITEIISFEKVEETLVEESEIVTEEMKKNKKAKETPEQKASRLERQKNAKVVKKVEIEEQILFSASIPDIETTTSESYTSASPQQFDGWAVVEEKRKLKTKKPESEGNSPSPTPEPVTRPVEEVSVPVPAPVSTPATAPAPVPAPIPVPEPVVIPTVTSEIQVEAKKLGLLIGPKGVTKIGIQNATGVEINMPKADKDATGLVTISVTGEAAAVKKAVNALNELVVKGYTTLLTPEDFVEGSVTVQSKSLPDIIGKNGSCIKAIQLHTGVKITTPSLPKADGTISSKIKIGLAGLRDQVSIARNLILDITKYYHTPVTHPTLVHKEVEVQGSYYNFIIGPKGSEIKHIQANYKVSVHIPNEHTHHQHVLIVGEPANVEATEKHILKLVEKADNIAAERALAAARTGNGSGHNWQPAANGNATNPNPAHSNGKQHHKEEKPEERAPGEEWMDEFTNRPTMALSAMLPADFGSKASTSTSSASNAVNSNSLSNENPTPAELTGKANADTNGSDPLALRNRGVWDR